MKKYIATYFDTLENKQIEFCLISINDNFANLDATNIITTMKQSRYFTLLGVSNAS